MNFWQRIFDFFGTSKRREYLAEPAQWNSISDDWSHLPPDILAELALWDRVSTDDLEYLESL